MIEFVNELIESYRKTIVNNIEGGAPKEWDGYEEKYYAMEIKLTYAPGVALILNHGQTFEVFKMRPIEHIKKSQEAKDRKRQKENNHGTNKSK